MRYRKLFLAVVCLILGGCSVGNDLSLSQQEVDKFHREYSAGQDQQSYDEAAPAFRKTVDCAKWLKLRSEIRRRLGRVRSTERGTFKEWLINGSHALEVVYQTKFDNGFGAEKFTWQFDGATAGLAGYYINLPLDAFPNMPLSKGR